METAPLISTAIRGYFLSQGKSILRLHGILSSNLFSYHLKIWSSIIIEFLLYCSFVLLISISLYLPFAGPGVTYETVHYSLSLNVFHPDYSIFMMFIAAILVLLAIPLLALALVLHHARRKSALIRTAFAEVENMKREFDQAVKEFSL